MVTPHGRIRLGAHLTSALHPRRIDAQHGWWFPERTEAEPELFGVFESNANVLCPNGAKFCGPEIGGWPHTALLCAGSIGARTLEARGRIELPHKGFADLSLTTWVPRR